MSVNNQNVGILCLLDEISKEQENLKLVFMIYSYVYLVKPNSVSFFFLMCVFISSIF